MDTDEISFEFSDCNNSKLINQETLKQFGIRVNKTDEIKDAEIIDISTSFGNTMRLDLTEVIK